MFEGNHKELPYIGKCIVCGHVQEFHTWSRYGRYLESENTVGGKIERFEYWCKNEKEWGQHPSGFIFEKLEPLTCKDLKK